MEGRRHDGSPSTSIIVTNRGYKFLKGVSLEELAEIQFQMKSKPPNQSASCLSLAASPHPCYTLQQPSRHLCVEHLQNPGGAGPVPLLWAVAA